MIGINMASRTVQAVRDRSGLGRTRVIFLSDGGEDIPKTSYSSVDQHHSFWGDG